MAIYLCVNNYCVYKDCSFFKVPEFLKVFV